MARDGVRRPATNGSSGAPQSWDGWLDADAEGAAAEIAALLRAARVNATVDPNDPIAGDPATPGARRAPTVCFLLFASHASNMVLILCQGCTALSPKATSASLPSYCCFAVPVPGGFCP